ncbi:beta-xylosidase [Deinococcus roseus]|uniref:beta-xylosidase n=1 Tax=Deinococcus roseus TaxID=392414 RepID=UPI00166CD12E|nr:beta-xylosidase [Deinococcus roseus]
MTRLSFLLPILLLASCQAQNAPAKQLNFRDFLGVNAQFLWFQNCPENPLASPEHQVDQLMEKMQELGLKNFRMDLHWNLLEPVQGAETILQHCLDPVMQQAKLHGLDPLLFLTGSAAFSSSGPAGDPFPDQSPPRDPADYARFLKKLALRYPEVKHWQVWNEPNLPSSWKTGAADLVQGYGKLLQTSVQALKNLNTEVMTAGFAYWSELPDGSFLLQKLQDQGFLKDIKTVAYHPYTFTPEGLTAYSTDPHFFLNRSKTVNAALQNQNKTVWATEFGWSTYPGPVEEQPLITPEQQADFLLKRIVLSAEAGFERIYLFTLTDLDARASSRDQFYGLLNTSGKPKPAFTALKHFLHVLKGDFEATSSPLPVSEQLQAYAWQNDQQTVMAFWGIPQTLKLPWEGRVLDPLTGRLEATSSQVQVRTTLQLLLLPPP